MTGYSIDQDRLYESIIKPPPEDFIRSYSNILDDVVIDRILELIRIRTTWWMQTRNDIVRSDRRIQLNDFDQQLSSFVVESVMTKGFSSYVDDFPYLKEDSWANVQVLLQETCPGQGYHAWHSENTRHELQGRVVTWMIYLNDIEDGGETEFLHQEKRFKPTKNTLLLWPAAYTHLHRGNPPLKQRKYILTGWISKVPEHGVSI